MKPTLVPTLFFVATALVAVPAMAHISLLEPAARYDGSVSGQSKACPCGVGESNRLCNVEGDRSDPDRSTNITTLQAGDTVTMRWDEYVGHSGRYRIAFDPDGADLSDFNDNIILDFMDPAGSEGNINDGSIWEVEFTVPDVTCNNCTLQLIQVMNGNTEDPVLDPIGVSSYYQCADIVIEGGGGGDIDAGMPDPDMGTGPEPQDMGGTPGDDVGTQQPPTPDAGGRVESDMGVVEQDVGEPVGDVDAGGLGGDGDGDDPGGCGCSSTPSVPALPILFFALVFVEHVRRRRS